MANTLKFGNGQWATKVGSTLAYNDENGNFKPLPFNFTRSTSATRVNKDGLIEVVTNNKPRIDFLNDSNGALLLEPQRTNLLPHSEFMTASNWQGGQTTANVILSSNLSPEGKANCYQVTRSSSGTSQVGIFTGITNGSTYTGSIYVRSISGSLSVSFKDVNGAGTTKSITTDWTRIDVTATASSTTGRLYLELVADGDVVEVYGAQLEEGSYATSYIPTQGAISTRVAEVCSQTPPSGIIGQTEGTVFMEVEVLNGVGIQLGNSTSGGDYVNSIQFAITPSSTNAGAHVGGVSQFSSASVGRTGRQKIAVAYGLNNYALYINGTQIAVDLSATVPSMSTIIFNHIDLGTVNGEIKQTKLYNTRLTNAELQQLTTI